MIKVTRNNIETEMVLKIILKWKSQEVIQIALRILCYFLQITEALLFLHGNCKFLHRNVCPTSIIITKRGTWKLSGFEFIGKSYLVIPHPKDRDTNRNLSIFSQYQLIFIN